MTVRRFQCPTALDQNTGRDLLESVREQAIGSGETVVLDMSQTSSVDSPGGAWLMQLADLVRSRKGEFRFEGQHGNVADFMDFIEPSLASVPQAPKKEEQFLERIGGGTLVALDEVKDFAGLVVDAIYWTFLAPFDGRGFRWGLLMDELYEMGFRAIRINCLMNFLLGLIVAMLSAAQLEQFGATIFVADLVVLAFARELGVIMTGVVVSARTGAAIASELATMEVQEEIDALRGMGLNVAQFLVAPKVLALIIVMPCLVMLAVLSGILGGTVWAVFVLDIDADAWFLQVQNAAVLSDYFQGILKSLVFAVVIVLIGCHNGLRVQGGSRGVGLMTTRAVVQDIFALIVIDMIFATLFYYVF